jgi:dCMP deaminase
MDNRELQFHQAYMKCAYNFAQLSRCVKKKVGAVIVREGRIISYGFNGSTSGEDNCCEDQVIIDGLPTLVTKPEIIHAEMNAILKLSASPESAKSADIYVTLAPCKNCARAIRTAKIQRVFYYETYNCEAGVQYLQDNGIAVVKLNM